jgi:hypothetical protein
LITLIISNNFLAPIDLEAQKMGAASTALTDLNALLISLANTSGRILVGVLDCTKIYQHRQLDHLNLPEVCSSLVIDGNDPDDKLKLGLPQ